MAEAHPEDRDRTGECEDRRDTRAGLGGCPGARRDHECVGSAAADRVDCEDVAADHVDSMAAGLEHLREVPDEGVAVVEKQDVQRRN